MEARLADLLAGLSRLADLGFGLQAGEALRSCALATRLARSLDLPEDDARAAFYTALLWLATACPIAAASWARSRRCRAGRMRRACARWCA